ncbi:MAG: hypothetical protein HYW49_05445 [Deltaproteobacteria bacterium]|nr:hypothetical protein [Deltaproteobacteria bacterium]
MKRNLLVLLAGVVLASSQANAALASFASVSLDAPYPPFSDDTDLTGRPYVHKRDVPLDLVPDRIDVLDSPGAEIRVAREDHGKVFDIDGLRFTVAQKGDHCIGTAPLANRFFAVGNGSEAYRLRFEAPCGKSLVLFFRQETDGGQALGIWRIGFLAQKKLEAAVGLDFWKSQIRFVWPAEGDYYQWNTVHITGGHKWDVVGHELGHAIYDQADIGVFGGGQHYIDRCYSGALALSEGWASFFSAWLSVDLADPDAKFEYMVPRRAPIRFENVPADVCMGPTSEWRVTAYFWDLIDLNRDGEALTEPFARLWAASRNARFRDMGEVARAYERAGLDPVLLKTVWNLNFAGGFRRR